MNFNTALRLGLGLHLGFSANIFMQYDIRWKTNVSTWITPRLDTRWHRPLDARVHLSRFMVSI
jgi:hypothetical protein